jgi:hypothetical protein
MGSTAKSSKLPGDRVKIILAARCDCFVESDEHALVSGEQIDEVRERVWDNVSSDDDN